VLVHLGLGSLVSVSQRAIYLKAYLLLVPLVTLISAYWSDRHQSRGITIVVTSVLAVIGFALYLSKVFCAWFRYSFPDTTCETGAEHIFVSYGALYLVVPGVYATGPVLYAWMANNSEPYYRRATTVALTFISSGSVCFAIKYLIFPSSLSYLSGRNI